MFPDQKKIELFARAPYSGWTVWGLDVPHGGSQFEFFTSVSP